MLSPNQVGYTPGNALQAIGTIADTVSGQKASREAQNKFNADQAEIARDWEEKMSNTAYQRAVKDMQAAGLNPAAMYGGGSFDKASTPTGKAATSGTGHNSLGEIASIVMSAAQLMGTINNGNELLNKQGVREANLLMKDAHSAADIALKKQKTEYYKDLRKGKFKKSNFSQRKYSDKDFENMYDDINTVEL